MKQYPATFNLVLVLGFVALGSVWSEAHAQAWVGDKGTLDLSLDYNFGTSDKVVGDKNVEFIDAGTTTQQITVGTEYVPIRNLALGVSLPLVLLKYTGNKTAYPHDAGGSYDNGKLHTTLTDLRAGVRYQLLEDPIALSPHLGVSIPVADYETIGNTVAGRHLKALHAGLGIGHVFGISTYVHLMYEFSLVEKYDRTPETAKYGQNRSDASFTIGHKLLEQRLDLHADVNMRVTHGGVNFSDFGDFTPDEEMFHDAILKESMVLVGGGLGYQITNSLAVNLAARLFVSGANTQNASVVAVGFGWSPL
jgi:hypothetical protein